MHDRYHTIRVNDAAGQVVAVCLRLARGFLKVALAKGSQTSPMGSLLIILVVTMASGLSIADAADTVEEQTVPAAIVIGSVENTKEGAEFTQVLEGVYVRYGRHEPVSADSIADIANHGFIIGETGVAIIDPGGSIDIANRTLTELRKITTLPVTHVIVSHVHPDHSLGLAAYVGDGFENNPVILGHRTLATALTQNLEFFKQHYASHGTTDKLLKLIEKGKIHAVNEELTFDLGNRKIVVASFDNAHSGSDISVYDQKVKALWAGDLLFVERLPAVDGSILGWLDALNQLDRYGIDTVIPGHGPSGEYAALMQPQHDYLNWVVRRTRDALAKGLSLNDFIASNGISSQVLRAKWNLFDSQHAINLSKSYTELEWE